MEINEWVRVWMNKCKNEWASRKKRSEDKGGEIALKNRLTKR